MLNLKRVFLVAMELFTLVYLVVSNLVVGSTEEVVEEVQEDVQECYETAIEDGIQLSYEDYYMVCAVVQGETGGAEVWWAELVAQVIKNRIDSDQFPNDAYSVLTQPNQFDSLHCYYDGIEIDDVTYQAVKNVFTGNAKTTERRIDGALYYCNPDILDEETVQWFKDTLTETYDAYYTVGDYTYHHVFYK